MLQSVKGKINSVQLNPLGLWWNQEPWTTTQTTDAPSHEPRHGSCNKTGTDLTMALGVNQATLISLFLPTITSSGMSLSTAHETLYLSLSYHTIHLLTVIVLICQAPQGSRWIWFSPGSLWKITMSMHVDLLVPCSPSTTRPHTGPE